MGVKHFSSYLKDISDSYNDGTYIIPEFQRDFVWKTSDETLNFPDE